MNRIDFFEDVSEFDERKKTSFFTVINDRLINKNDLLKSLAHALVFPPYFGMNWDALKDMLSDMNWIDDIQITIVHKDISCFNNKDLIEYISVINECLNFWESREEHKLLFLFPAENKFKIT